MPIDITFKKTAKERIVKFLHSIDATKVDRAAQCFPRAAAALFQRRSPLRLDPAAVVAHYDGETTYRLFDSARAAFQAYVEYRAENAPCVLITISALRYERADFDAPFLG